MLKDKKFTLINPKTFITDFRKLFLESPQCGAWTRNSENCDYGDITVMSKDCYMCFNTGSSRNAYYCEDCRAMNDCVDCAFCEECELSYECTDCNNCYNSRFCQDCNNCDDVQFCYDCRRCKNCVGCLSLRDKQYCIFNEQYNSETYQKALKNLNISDEKILKIIDEKSEVLKLKTPRMFAHQLDTQNCVGDYIYHSKNAFYCFDTRHTEDSGYIVQANLDKGTKDSFDCGPVPTAMELCYDVCYSDYCFNCDHIYWCSHCKDLQYSTNCIECENLFGCNLLLHKKDDFYILNQKVEKEEYKKLTQEIKKELLKNGIYSTWDLLFKDISKSKKHDLDEEKSRTCELCGADFELTKEEIEFYKKKNIVYPRYCFQCRLKQRYAMRNERKMHKRICDSCKNPFISTYPPDSKYIVYCLNCFWKHIS